MSNNFHLQLYRGTTAQNNAYTGLSGEVTVDTTLSKLRLHDGSTAGGVEIGGMPVGSIIPYAGTTIPAGYLLCDGSAISRTTYSALFASIGTTYGEGDGNSTFNLPTKYDCGNMLPSSNYVDLTIGDTGTTYIAPANGWVFFSRCNNNAASTWICISGINALSVSSSTDQAWTLQVVKPVKKGEVFRINYILASGSWRTSEDNLRFFYTEGQRSIIKY